MTTTIFERKMKEKTDLDALEVAQAIESVECYNTDSIRPLTIEVKDPNEVYKRKTAEKTPEEKKKFDKLVTRYLLNIGVKGDAVRKYVQVGLEEELNTHYKSEVIGEGKLRPGYIMALSERLNTVLPD